MDYDPAIGMVFVSRLITWGTIWAACLICSTVVYRLIENRIEPCATGSGMPMASSTGEGSSDPLEHAAPADAQTPASLKPNRIASASRWAKPIFVVFQIRGMPFTFGLTTAPAHADKTARSKSSRTPPSCAMRDWSAKNSCANWAATRRR